MKVALVLCFLAVSANAFSLDALRSMLEDELEKKEESKVVTLKEYLDGLEEPHPLFRSRSEKDCSTVCKPVTLHKDASCETNKWVPEYVEQDGCECLSKYRCCAEKCKAEESKQVCWNDGQKGFKYGIEEVDCCGCKVIKCLDCDAPQSFADACPKTYDSSCYAYTKNAKFVGDNQCYESGCERKASDAAPAQPFDAKCQKQDTQQTTCGYTETISLPNRLISVCVKKEKSANHPQNPSGLHCYEPPTEVDDDANGHYWKENSCAKCKKWQYTKKSCNAKNAATALEDCHQHGAKAYDKKCMKKEIVKDECLCDDFICELNNNDPTAKFGDGEVCPKGSVKMAGTSICGSARDICFQCPPVTEPECAVGSVEETADCNNCPVKICVPPTASAQTIEACVSKQFTFDEKTNMFKCV